MKKRPLCMMCLLIIAWLFVNTQLGEENKPQRAAQKGLQICVKGQLLRQEQSDTSNILYLIHNSISFTSDSKSYPVQDDTIQTTAQNHITEIYSRSKKNSEKEEEIKGQIVVYPQMLKGNDQKDNMSYKPGNWLEVAGIYEEAEPPGNPGQFDTVNYYKTKGIQFAVKKAEIKVLDDSYWVLQQWMAEAKSYVQRIFQKIMGEENASVLSAMLLGEKKGLDKEVKTLYQNNGIAHILAISGLHISLLGMGLYRLLKKAGLPLKICLIFSGMVMTMYGIMTGFGISSRRAVIMFLVYLLAKLLGRTYDILSALALASIIILLTSKDSLYDVGFLLSFLAVLGVAAVAPILKQLTGKRQSKIWDALSVSLAVQYTTIPMILHFFFVIPLYGILLNLCVIPLMSLVLIFGLIGALAGMIFLPLGIFAAAPCVYILNFYKVLCEFTMELPFASIISGQPQLWQSCVYFTGLVLLCVIPTKNLKRNAAKWGIGSVLILGILLYRPHQLLKITFLDVGQGDGIFLQTPQGSNYFIDGGSSSVSNVAKMRIEPYLKSQGAGVLDYYFLSHLDEDHMNGLEEMLNNYKPNLINQNTAGITIKHLVLPKLKEKNQEYLELVKSAAENNIEVIYLEKGDRMTNGNMVLTCLHPAGDFETSNSNAASMVLEISCGRFRTLMTGDVEGLGEEALVEGNLLRDIDILKVAHHGSKNSTEQKFLDIVKPEYSIISCGENNRYGHPHKELLKRLSQVNSRYLMTFDTGAVSVFSDGLTYSIETFQSAARMGER